MLESVSLYAAFQMNKTQFLTSQSPRTPQKGIRNFFHPKAQHSGSFPHSYQMPGRMYEAGNIFRHRDPMRRVWKGYEDDRYLRPSDGRAVDLIVQSTDDIYDGPTNSTWRRTYVRNISALIIRVAYWPMRNVPSDVGKWTRRDWTTVGLWWLPTCIALLLVVCFPGTHAEIGTMHLT